MAQERIHYLANFDPLTGLPNRAQLNDHLKYALSLAKRSNGHLTLMFLDLDHFKDINDTLGHSVGDALLIELAKRMRLVLREFLNDMPGQIAALREHVHLRDVENAGRKAHLIKGAASNVGGEALRAVAYEMEKAGMAGNMEAVAAQMDAMEDEFDRLAEAMQQAGADTVNANQKKGAR